MQDSKAKPNKNYTSFIILQGYVMHIGKGQTIINCPTAGSFPVKWKGKLLPDGVTEGSYITFYGKIITLELGRAFIVTNAEVLPADTLRKFKQFVQEESTR